MPLELVTTLSHTDGTHRLRPYFGQLFFFLRYHNEKIPSAIERYKNEVLRVFKVLDGVLTKQPWLVGNRLTVADLSFAV